MTAFHRLFNLSMAATICCALAAHGCMQNKTAVASQPHADPKLEIFVLPKDYRGPFLAIYGQSGGVLPRWRGDTAEYAVPSNGILKISLKEPPHSTKVSHVFSDKPGVTLRNIPTCADMRVHVAASDNQPSICWLDYSIGGTGTPSHVVAVVTDWAGIPINFNRTSFVYDSVLSNGSGKSIRKWTEPPELVRKSRSG